MLNAWRDRRPLPTPFLLAASAFPRRWRDLDSVAKSTIAGALVAVVVATTTVGLIDARLTEILVSEVSARAVDQVELWLLDRVSAADFDAPHTSGRLAELSARLDPLMERVRREGSGIIRVNLVAADGGLIYSDRPAIRGQVVAASDDALLATALSGRVASARDSLTGTENVDLKPAYATAIEVYVPVVLDGRVVGAYEIYHDLGLSVAIEVVVWLFIAGAIVLLAHVVARSVVASGTSRQGGRVIECQPVPPGAFSRLTARELDVLELLATTHSYRDIAARLSVSDETVRSHVKRILHKLGQPDRTQAVMAAVKAGLLQLS